MNERGCLLLPMDKTRTTTTTNKLRYLLVCKDDSSKRPFVLVPSFASASSDLWDAMIVVVVPVDTLCRPAFCWRKFSTSNLLTVRVSVNLLYVLPQKRTNTGTFSAIIRNIIRRRKFGSHVTQKSGTLLRLTFVIQGNTLLHAKIPLILYAPRYRTLYHSSGSRFNARTQVVSNMSDSIPRHDDEQLIGSVSHLVNHHSSCMAKKEIHSFFALPKNLLLVCIFVKETIFPWHFPKNWH